MKQIFLLQFKTWTDWAKANPAEYKRFDVLAKVVFKGGEITKGEPRTAEFKVYKVKPWPQVYSFMGRSIKEGYDPEQMYRAVEFIVTHNKTFEEHPNRFALLKKVMKDGELAAGEFRWQQVKMDTPKPMRSILKDVLKKLEGDGV